MTKLLQNSRAVLLLRKNFELGNVKEDDTASKVRASEDLFKKHKPRTFSTCFYKIRKDYFPPKSQRGKILLISPLPHYFRRFLTC